MTIILLIGAVFAAMIQFIPSQEVFYIIGPWIYIPCFLYASRYMKSKGKVWLWFFFWIGSFVIRFWGIVRPFDPHISIGLSFAGSIVYSIPFVVDHFTYQKGSKIVSWLMFPCISVVLDYVMELLHLGSLFSIAQTQFDNKPLLQICSLLGGKGICFILTLFASLIVYHRKSVKRSGFCILAIFLVHLCGMARILVMAPYIDQSEKVTIGWSAEPIAEAAIDDSFFAEGVEGRLDPNIEYLASAIEKAKEKDIQFLCFPEECFYVYKEYLDSFIKEAQRLAREKQLRLLLSVESDDPDHEEIPGSNQCLLIDEKGRILTDYLKSILIPVVEEPYYYSGTGILPYTELRFDGAAAAISYAICFDGDFAHYVRTISDSANLFIDVSWDWDEIADLHYRIIGLRSVENGITVLKPTIDGYTTVTDYLGCVHSKTHTDETGYADVCLVEVPLAKCNTIYHRYGFFIDLLYVAGTIILFMFYLGRRRQKWKRKSH